MEAVEGAMIRREVGVHESLPFLADLLVGALCDEDKTKDK